jgi:hypothetical protein
MVGLGKSVWTGFWFEVVGATVLTDGSVDFGLLVLASTMGGFGGLINSNINKKNIMPATTVKPKITAQRIQRVCFGVGGMGEAG